MVMKIIIALIAAAVLAAGVYFLVKEGKQDKDARKIYGIISAIGAVVLAIMIILIVQAL